MFARFLPNTKVIDSACLKVEYLLFVVEMDSEALTVQRDLWRFDDDSMNLIVPPTSNK